MEPIIKELHRLYADFKRPVYLEMAKELGTLAKKPTNSFEGIWEQRVNAGCERNNLPNIYS